MGKGKNVSFWNEYWFNKSTYLRDVAKRHLSEPEMKEIDNDFILSNGEWKLRHYLPKDICNGILKVKGQVW